MRLALAALALVGIATPALADWQNTKWDMTAEQVIAASNGTAKAARDDKGKRIGKQRRLVVGEVTVKDTKLPVDFYFEDKKLKRIRYDLGLEDGCAAKEELFLAAYGPAEPKLDTTEFPGRNMVYGKNRTRTWQMPDGDQFEYTVIWFERPDLPGMKSKAICMAAITPPGKAG